jgi:U3 small nucleolar RNA-associated protein 12
MFGFPSCLLPLSKFFFQIALGTKTGEILIYDLASSSLIQTVQAHTATVWSLHVRPDEKALVSGSADKDVKFWEFEYTDPEDETVSSQTVFLFRK